MAFSRIATASKVTVNLISPAVTTAADFSGVDLIVICAVNFQGSALVPSDNQMNSYTVQGYSPGDYGYGTINVVVAYKFAPTTSVSQTFTSQENAAVIWVGGYIYGSGGSADQISAGGNNGGSSTTFTVGSITPGSNDELVIGAVGCESTDNPPFSVSAGPTLVFNSPGVSTAFGMGVAELIQTTAATSNPTFTIPTSSNHAWGMQMSFAGGGGGATTQPMMRRWGGRSGPVPGIGQSSGGGKAWG